VLRSHLCFPDYGQRVPTAHAVRDFVGTDGFMSYGLKITDLFRRVD